ncbi:sugar ABC transporter substrate-binding protein [Luxibacter massiliensis]|uniref:sugar ABC transporter substrate-binding protein n=1 Tax=Luxibacter massiliensis TaxID=2219695 RepID=UPI000F04674F|nr:sugar ABC transporter substrate-binding protein [Luxibacter massiliensis]
MKKFVVFVLMVCMTVVLSACGSGGSANEGGNTAAEDKENKKTLALVPPAMISPYYKSVISGAQEACDDLGYELKTLAPESESDYASQVQIVEDMITQQVDGIILCAINSDAIVAAVKKANEAEIPVVMFNTQNELAGGEVACYVRYDQYEAGGKVCDFVAEQFGEDLQVAIVEGLPSDHTTERMGGFVDKAEEKYPGIQVVASQAGDWEREKGMNAAANMIQANPDLDVIFALCDEMGLGAVQAVKEAGSDAKVVSFDGNPNAVASIQAGELVSTVSIGGPGTGVTCVEALDKIFNGGTVEKIENVDTEIIWEDNADQFPSEAD